MHRSLSCWRRTADQSQRRRLKEAPKSDGIIDDMMASDSAIKLILKSMLSWRRLTDKRHREDLHESMNTFKAQSEERIADLEENANKEANEIKSKAKIKVARAERRVAEVEKERQKDKSDAQKDAERQRATVASLQDDLQRLQTSAMQVF